MNFVMVLLGLIYLLIAFGFVSLFECGRNLNFGSCFSFHFSFWMSCHWSGTRWICKSLPFTFFFFKSLIFVSISGFFLWGVRIIIQESNTDFWLFYLIVYKLCNFAGSVWCVLTFKFWYQSDDEQRWLRIEIDF